MTEKTKRILIEIICEEDMDERALLNTINTGSCGLQSIEPVKEVKLVGVEVKDEFWICFSCLHDFKPTDFCKRCTWAKCPHCLNCLCSIAKSERRVAIAVWLSHVQVPPDTKKRFLEIAKRGLPHD